MPDLEDLLHDSIDAAEDLDERAADIVETVKSRFSDIVGRTGDINAAMQAVAILVENDLARLTTEAVAVGAANVQRLGKPRG